MNRKFLRLLSLAVGVVVTGAISGYAQNITGTVSGVVTDTTGAVISGAHVVVHDLGTGVDSSTTTDSAGVYRIAYLPIGQYTESVTAQGFGTKKIPPFHLEAIQTINFNVTLAAGGGTTTVKVSAAAPILNTSNATLGGTITANTIRNFPLNGLDFSALTLYIPGAVSTAGTSGTTSIERSTYYTDSVNIDGNRAQANNYTLDGIDINETFNNLISYSPSPDALEEVKVVTANSPIDFGNVNGGGVASVLKSGTNHFHGSAFGYVQDYRLNANSWANNQLRPKVPINPFSQSQFGGSLGGPILHNKLFFFVDYLGSRYHQGGTGYASVFTQAMRNGDFSTLLAAGNPVQLYNSQDNFAPYADDKGIPVVNPVAKYLFANTNIYPLPNATPTDGIAKNDYEAPTRTYKANNQGDIKIEWDPRNSDKITGFYSMSTGYDATAPVLAISFNGVNVYPTKLGGVNWVHIFSPTLVNNLHVGFTRTVWKQGFSTDSTGLFGDSGDAKVGIPFPNQSFAGYTYQSIGGGITAGGNPVYGAGSLIDNTYSYMDDVTWQHGKHTFSFGTQSLRYQNNYPTANNDGYLGILSYSGAFTSDPAASSVGGYGGADFLLDYVSQAAATLSSVNVGQRQWRAAFYANDEYRVLPRLTLTYGLRYEYDQPWVEENNKTGNVDIATGQVLYAHAIPTGAPPGSGICSNRGCYNPQNDFMPRVGFAYQATNRFVIRGGYGATSFFEGNSSNQRLTSITPFIQAVNVTTVAPTPGNPGTPRTAEEGFTGGSVSYGGTFNVYPKDIKPAYVQEWNLTTEYALTNSMSLQVSYLGEQGQHIEDYGNLNQYKVNGDPTSAPYYNNQYLGVNANPATSIGPNPLLITESRAASNYQALQAVLRERLSRGLEFTVNYTYGKSLTNSLGNYGLQVNGYSGAFQNYYNSAADWGPAGYDVRHNLSWTMVYALPFGRGRQFLSHINHIEDEVIGGWRFSTVGVAYTGFPETLTAPGNNSQSFGNSRPNQYRKLKIVNRSLLHWFGTDPSATPCTKPGVDNGVCAYGVPAPNTFGTAGNGSERGPGYLNVDMSAMKDFHVYRDQTLGFRFDAFNALNIVSYGNPDTSVTDSHFGNVSFQDVRSVERHLQFSLHYRF